MTTNEEHEIIASLGNSLRIFLKGMTDRERTEVFQFIADGYCDECGCERDGICHCTNDE